MRPFLVPWLLLPGLLACASPGPGPFQSPLHADHPLVGRIHAPGEAEPVSWPDLLTRARTARFVLLGEVHDNADHHRLQARLIDHLIDVARPDAVVLEMIDRDRQSEVDTLLSAGVRDPEVWAARLQWSRSGWPPFALYRPVFATVLEAKLPVRAAGLPARAAAEPGDPAWRARFGLDEPLPPAAQDARLDEMFESHCELLPRSQLGPMVEIQRARDARLAEALLAGAGGAGRAVLIAGAGHVREHGVPRLLVRAGVPRPDVLALGLLEVDPDAPEPQAAALAGFDVVLFTPRAEREDPCEQLRRRIVRRGPQIGGSGVGG